PFPAEDAHLRRRTPCPRAPRRDPAVADNDPRSGSPTDSRSDPPREPASPADTPRQPPTGVLTARSGLVRFRAKLSNLRTGLKAQAHAVMAKNGVLPCRGDMWGIGGAAPLHALPPPPAHPKPRAGLPRLLALFRPGVRRVGPGPPNTSLGGSGAVAGPT